ncbi:MAG: lipopolysaccharide heptosyltransferase II [Blastochloris sp.]|nr:lipopolysaccharide heptosyltransferase II [Blastochloris sp.]
MPWRVIPPKIHPSCPPLPPRHLLIRSPNWLGDAVMTLPAVQLLLHELNPDDTFSLLAPTKLHDFWKQVPGLHFILPVDPNLVITADTLRSHNFSHALLFPNSLRSALEVALARIPQRLGYPGHSRSWLLTHSIPKYSRRLGLRHQQHDYLDLIHVFLEKPENTITPNFHPLPRPTPNLDSPTPSLPYIVLCPGAEYGPAKRWPADRYAVLARHLAESHCLPIYVLGSESDIPVAEILQKKAALSTDQLINLTGKTSLASFIQFIAHARLLLCNDSGSMHLAAAFGTPPSPSSAPPNPNSPAPSTPPFKSSAITSPAAPASSASAPSISAA